MRMILLLAGTAMLSACGGAGSTVASAPTPTPTAGGGGGGTLAHTFVTPAEAKTYAAVGGSQVLEYTTDNRHIVDTSLPNAGQQAVVFAENATTVRGATQSNATTAATIAYDPRSAIYTLTIKDPNSGAATDTRFQDPAARTDFGGAKEPLWGTPNLNNANIQYLQAGDGNPIAPYTKSGTGFINEGTNQIAPTGQKDSTFQSTSMFLLKPGSITKYVTYAGYARNTFTVTEADLVTDPVANTKIKILLTKRHLERGAFAFGELTTDSAVPTAGTGTYNGAMLASLMFNPTLDGQDQSGTTVLPSYFQWISGTSKVDVNFAASSFALTLNGTVSAPFFDQHTTTAALNDTVLKAGATFAATGAGAINLVNFGGFKGSFASAIFQNPGGGSTYNVAIAGSSIDGAFYGPAADEVGGGFHIVGGKPDERIDVIGAFVGAK